jgi:hypothetical protein
MLSIFLLPYLISSIYAIVSKVVQVPGTPNWLWGDWLSTLASGNRTLYMILAEGPICCAGTLGLLIVILGVVMMISSLGQDEEYFDKDEYELDEEPTD